jgi:uncharacterized protein YoxC
MADHDIQKFRHLLKTLNEEMVFLNGVMAETTDLVKKMNSLSAQVIFVSSSLKNTWNSLDKIHKTSRREGGKEESL